MTRPTIHTVTVPATASISLQLTGHRPLVTDTLWVAEACRRAVMSMARRDVGPDADLPQQVVGRDDAVPSRGHRHLFVLPRDDDQDGRIDAILLYSQGTLDLPVHRAISSLKTIRVDRRTKLDVTATASQPSSPTRTFESTTPFLLPRHPKYRAGQPRRAADGQWVHGPEAQLRFLLAAQSLPSPLPLRACDVRYGMWSRGRLTPWRDFRLDRRHGDGQRGLAEPFGFHLRFDEPVQPPLALGYGAHFGLGQFRPVPSPLHLESR